MLFGALACVIFFLLFKEISTGRSSFFAFFLIAFSNFHLFTSQNARVYSLLCLLVFLTLLLTVLYVIVAAVTQLTPGYRIVSFLVLGTVLVVVSLIFTRVRARWRAGSSDGSVSSSR